MAEGARGRDVAGRDNEMTKRIVNCPICERDLGRYHHNQSVRPVRDHIHDEHPADYEIIVSIVEEIDARYDLLKNYNIRHFDTMYFHRNVKTERNIENMPPLTEEQRAEFIKKLMEQD